MSEPTTLTNDILKGIMTDALVAKGICPDLNTCFTPGMYSVYPQTQNVPSGINNYGALVVLTASTGYGLQILFARGPSGKFIYRSFICSPGSEDPSVWFLVQGTLL